MRGRHQFVVAALCAALGCAPLNVNHKPSGKLPANRLAPDAVVLDIAFVRLPATDTTTDTAAWNAADEQVLPTALRRELAANGLRAGVLGQKLPVELERALDAPADSFEKLSEQAALDLEVGATRQHLPVRAGHRSIIKTSPVYPSLAMLLSEDGVVRGHQLTDARCTLCLKAYPQGDSRVKLSLSPEIEHGESKTHWVRGEGMMLQQTGQSRMVLQRLLCEATLSPGQCLLLGSTPEAKGLGQHFFGQAAASGGERRLILIRLSQTQLDDLFAPEQTSAPLATPGE